MLNRWIFSNCRYVLFILFWVPNLVGAAYTDLIVFGDSLSDIGNDHANSFGIVAGDPYYQGRFTNGPNYVDYLADNLGMSAPLYSEAGGLNYAHGGAYVATDPLLTSWVIDSLDLQYRKYMNSTNGVADADALYVVLGGANDVRDTSINVEQSASDLINIVSGLVDAGASKVLVANVPDLGKTPEVTQFNRGAKSASTERTMQFNAALAQGLDELSTNNAVVQFDAFNALNEIMADAMSGGDQYGFSNITDDCWEGGPRTLFGGFGLGDPLIGSYPVCDNPDEYIYWDMVHPTTAAHEVFAELALAQLRAVPLPGAVVLLFSGFGFLLLYSGKRRSCV